MRTLADRIRHLIKLRGVDQRTFARDAGLSSSYVSVFLSNARENPDAGMGAERLDAIAKRWGADPQWLLHGAGTPPSKVFDPATAPSRSQPQTPPSVTKVVRDATTARGSEDGNPLQKALGEAFDASRHTVLDLRRVDDLMGDFDMELAEVDLVTVARRWLNAAAALRKEGVPFGSQAMLLRLAAGANSDDVERASRQRASEQLEALDALAPRNPMEGADDEPPPRAPAGPAAARKARR